MPESSGQFPATPPQTPGFPSNPYPLVWEGFTSVQTKPTRNAIKDEECFVMDGFMPIGMSNLRTLPDVGTALYTASGILTVVSFYFANLSGKAIAVVLLSDGSLVQVDTNTAVATAIAPAGTILAPSKDISVSQSSGDAFVIIVAPQTNGYWLWNGSVLATAGTLSLEVTVVAGGSSYSSTPTVTASGGSGTGTAFLAHVSNGIVISVDVTNAGSGYVVGDAVTLSVTGGGGSGASLTTIIMPFGVDGTLIETFVGRSWVGNGPSIIFSAPESVVDFSTADGGGEITSQDSFLRVGFFGLKQANGFLYAIGDSSINTISGVSTTGTSPPTTTLTNQNVDPQIGTPWKNSVQVFSRNIVFANSFGIHVSYGGAVTKISSQLDGIYNSVPNIGNFQPSSAVASIYGIQCYMLLYPIIDQYTGVQVNKLLMWDGQHWWTSQQGITLKYIASQEINSILTAWGTDGKKIYPLLQTPSNNYTRVTRSKLWKEPGYFFTKTAREVFGLLFFTQLGGDTTIFIDSESGTSASYDIDLAAQSITWVNNSNQAVQFVNNANQNVYFVPAAFGIFRTAVGQWGTLLGMTVVSTDADITLSSFTLFTQTFQTNL